MFVDSISSHPRKLTGSHLINDISHKSQRYFYSSTTPRAQGRYLDSRPGDATFCSIYAPPQCDSLKEDLLAAAMAA
jgi:hypothetical protein